MSSPRVFPDVVIACLLTFSVTAQEKSAPQPVDWDRSITVGFGGEAGNNENYSISVSSDIEFTGASWRGEIVDLSLAATSIRRDDGENEELRDHKVHYDGNLKRSFANGKFGPALTWEWNDSRSDYGSVSDYWDVGLGVNWNVSQGEKLRFEFDSIGLTWREDRLGRRDTVSDLWGSVESSLEYQLSESASFEWESELSLNPDDEATEESRFKSKQELELTSSLTKVIHLSVDATWIWDSADLDEDSANVDGYDVTVSVGIGASW